MEYIIGIIFAIVGFFSIRIAIKDHQKVKAEREAAKAKQEAKEKGFIANELRNTLNNQNMYGGYTDDELNKLHDERGDLRG